MPILAPGIASVSITTVGGTYKDLADFGFVIRRPNDMFSGPRRTYPTIGMPGVMQAVRLNASPTGGVRSVTIQGTVVAATSALLTTNIRNLRGYCAQAVALKTLHDANSFLQVSKVHATVSPHYPLTGLRAAEVTIEFEAADPFWYATSQTTATFTAAPASTPLGTADSYPLVRITGALTNPTITVKDSGGVTVATMALTITLANAAHYVEIDCAPITGRTIVKHTGSLSAAEDTLTSGDFFGFLVANADIVTPAYGTIEASVSAGAIASATAIYRAAYE
jgi:hypothetical protein